MSDVVVNLAVGLVLVMVLPACAAGPAGPAGGPPDGDPYIEGEVDQVVPFVPVTESCLDTELLEPERPVSDDDPVQCSRGDEGPGSIVVRSEDNTAAVTLSPDTEVFAELGGGYEPADFSQLRQGQRVAVWVTGPVAESFPVQATADAIIVREMR